MSITTITIEDTRFNPATKSILRSFWEVPEVYEPQLGKKAPVRSNYLTGVSANVPKNHFLSSLLILNEINACKGKPIQRDSLRRQMLREYPDHHKAVLKYFYNFSQNRHLHNQGLLYKAQDRPPLYAWLYNDAGYIYHPIAKTVMGFEDCLLELKSKGVIDPRFHKAAEIAAHRYSRLQGNPKALRLFIPTQEDIERLIKNIFPNHVPEYYTKGKITFDVKCPLYNCITFPEGYGPGYK